MSKPSSVAAEEQAAAHAEEELRGPLSDLVTMRLISIFSLLRRREILAHRQQFDLSEVEWHIMTLAGERAPFSLNRLATLTAKDEGQISRTVKKMTARGLLQRGRKPGGPEIEIDLTQTGRALYNSMVERAIARDHLLTRGISAEDLVTLWRITGTMIANAQELLDDERKLDA